MLALSQLIKSFGPLVAGLIKGMLVLYVEITSIASGINKSFNSFIQCVVSMSVFLAKRGSASAIEVDRRNSEAVDSAEAHGQAWMML